jgi:ligand-binding sensor domain-containing protein/signal transduction histidine kinase
MTRFFLSFFPLLLLMGHLGAQPYYFRRYEVENGLSNATVYCAIQDQLGFMWFGTKDGINRFDGYRFKTFNVYPGETPVNSQYIYQLAMDSSGTIWAGTGHGIYRYDRQNERFLSFIDSASFVRALYFDKKGRLWYAASDSLYRYDFVAKNLTAFSPRQYFEATSLFEEGGYLWSSDPDGRIHRMDLSTGNFISYDLFGHSPKTNLKGVNVILPDEEGGFYVGTRSGIKYFDMRTATYKDLLIFNDTTPAYVHTILRAGPSEYWFGTESGIYILNTGTGRFTHLQNKRFNPYSLSDNFVFALYKDAEGGIWAGTYWGGLSYFSRQVFPSFEKYFPDGSPNSLSGYAVDDVCQDPRGKIWIATHDAGLNKLDAATGEMERFTPTGLPGSITYSNILSLLVVGNDLWIGTFQHGLDILDTRTGKVRRHIARRLGKGQMGDNLVFTMLRVKSGEIYLGTTTGVYRYDPVKDEFDQPATLPQSKNIICLAEDREGTLWVGSYFGIYYFNPRTGRSGHFANDPDNPNSVSNNSINAILEDSFHELWFATNGGLCRLGPDRKNFTRYTTSSGMPGNLVFKILEDDRGRLWVTTSKGLVNLDRNRNITAIYTRSNGLLTDQFSDNSGYKDDKGRLYFGSIRGMISFRPDSVSPAKFTPSLDITGFQVNNKELEPAGDSVLKQSLLCTDEIVLPHDQASFSIDFAAVSFTSPAMTEYRYIMEGLEKDWTFLKRNRKVYFTRLQPGSYTFRVKATGEYFSGQMERELRIKILPPFWATAWAYFTYLLLSGGLSWYIFRLYSNRQRIKKEKEIYAAKIEFFTHVAHEIKTPLTLIKGPMENLRIRTDNFPALKDDVMTMDRNTDRLLDLVNQLLDFHKTEISAMSLQFSQVNINVLLREAYLAFEPIAQKRKLSWQMDLPVNDVYVVADEEALYKIVSNLFSNAAKYAGSKVVLRMPDPGNGSDPLVIQVSNDGNLIPSELKEKIFEPFYRMKGSTNQKGTGIGLALARSLAALHKGSLHLNNQENGMNTFILILPIK